MMEVLGHGGACEGTDGCHGRFVKCDWGRNRYTGAGTKLVVRAVQGAEIILEQGCVVVGNHEIVEHIVEELTGFFQRNTSVASCRSQMG